MTLRYRQVSPNEATGLTRTYRFPSGDRDAPDGGTNVYVHHVQHPGPPPPPAAPPAGVGTRAVGRPLGNLPGVPVGGVAGGPPPRPGMQQASRNPDGSTNVYVHHVQHGPPPPPPPHLPHHPMMGGMMPPLGMGMGGMPYPMPMPLPVPYPMAMPPAYPPCHHGCGAPCQRS